MRTMTMAFALALAPAFASSIALAQSPEEFVKEEARDLYRKGRARLAAGQFDQARASFLAAWGIEKHWSIALNLGECELEMERFRDAAEYLELAVRRMPEDYERRQDAVDWLERARARVATVRIDVGEAGADVFIDAVLVGRSPLPAPIFVEPGTHALVASLAGRAPVRQTIVAREGEASTITMAFRRPEPSAPPPAPAPVRTHAAAQPATDEASGPSARTIVTVGGAALTVAAAGIGLGYSRKASSASDEADGLREQVDRQLGPSGCGGASLPVCDDLQASVDERDAASRVATYAWIGAGALLTATVSTYLLWPDATKSSDVSLAPLVMQRGAALSFQGRFQ